MERGDTNLSSTIDNRVVEMQFNNKQFENGVKTSLDSLNKLKATLNFDGAAAQFAKGFSSVENTLSVNSIAKNLESISDRFSAFGIIGGTVLSNLTTKAMGLVSSLSSLAIGPIVEGGKTRALNLEAAKFQLSGLKVAWEDIESDINYGVQDTAYGLDAAAKVASQLVASNVQLGDSMKTALRGVSGVAAMTSSSFEDIGHIFTTVAGQGRLMGMQLTQLSMKGINAAATLGQALNKTEAEIRDMVSKGQIDFATFAKAMDDAYGEHAKDANKTFTGALSNTRAALARIGAKFATPAFENIKNVLNSLIPVINGVNKALDPFVDVVSNEMRVGAETVSDLLNSVDEQKLKTIGDIVSDSVVVLKNIKKLLVDISSPAKTAFNELFPDPMLLRLRTFTKKISESSAQLKIASDRANQLHNIFSGVFGVLKLGETMIVSVISLLASAFNAASDIIDKIVDKLSVFGNRVANLVKFSDKTGSFKKNITEIFSFFKRELNELSPHIRVFTENVKALAEPFSELFAKARHTIALLFKRELSNKQKLTISLFCSSLEAAGESIANIGIAAARAFRPIQSAFIEMFPQIGMRSVLEVTRAISDLTKKLIIQDSTATKIMNTAKGLLAVVDIAVQFVSAVIRTLFPATNLLDGFGNCIFTITGGLGEWLAALSANLRENDTFYTLLQNIIGFINNGFDSAKQKVLEFIDTYEELTGKKFKMPTLEDVIERFKKLKETFSWVPDLFINAANAVRGFFEWLNKDESGNKAKSIETLINVFDKLSEMTKNSPDVSGFFSNIGVAFDNINFERMGKLLNIGMFIVLLDAIVKLRNAFYSLFDWNLYKNINGTFSSIKVAFSTFTKDMRANTIVKIAQAVALLSGALIGLSMVDGKRLDKAISVMTILFVDMFAFMRFGSQMLSGWDVSKLGFLVIEITASVLMLVSAVEKLTKLRPDQLASGVSAVIGLLAALTLAANYLPKGSNAELLKAAGSIVVVSLAMNILAKALAKMDKLENSWQSLAVLSGALLVIGASALYFGSSAPNMFAFALGILTVSTAMVALSSAINALSSSLKSMEQLENVWTSISAVAAMIALMISSAVIWTAVAPQMVGFAVGLAVVCSALLLLIPVLKALDDLKNTVNSIGAIAAVLTVIGASGVLWGAFAPQLFIFANALVVLSTAILMLAPALVLLSTVKITDLINVLLVLTGALSVFVVISLAIGSVMPTMMSFAGVLLSWGAGFVVLGAGLSVLSIGLTLLSSSTVGLTVLIYSLGSALVALVDSLVDIGMALLNGLEALIPKIVQVSAKIVVSFVMALTKYIPIIVNCGMMLLLGILKGIDDHLDDILIVTDSILLKLLDGLSRILPDLVNAGMELMIRFIDGMANAIRNNTEPLFNALRNLTSSIIEFVISALQLLVVNIPYIGDQLYDALEKAKKTVRDFIAPDDMEQAGSGSAQAMADGLNEGDDDVQNAGAGLAESAKNGVSSMLPSFSSLGGVFGSDFSSYLSDTEGDSQSAGTGVGKSAVNGLEDMLPDFSSLGNTFGSDFSSALGDTDALSFDAASMVGDSAMDGLDLDFSSLGLGSGKTYADGLLDTENKARNSGASVADSGISAMNSKYGDFRSSGHDAGTGFADGLFLDSRAEVYDSAANLARVALNSMRATLDEHSPSKETRMIGKMSGEGLSLGITDCIGIVRSAGEVLAENAMDSLRKPMRRVSSMLADNIDVDPTIRPVVDMSEVMKSAKYIDGVFGSRELSLGTLNGRISYRNAAAMSGGAKDGVSAQPDNSGVINSITELRKDVSVLADKISKMRIVMDTGAFVGAIADPMDDELGRRLALRRRGV